MDVTITPVSESVFSVNVTAADADFTTLANTAIQAANLAVESKDQSVSSAASALTSKGIAETKAGEASDSATAAAGSATLATEKATLASTEANRAESYLSTLNDTVYNGLDVFPALRDETVFSAVLPINPNYFGEKEAWFDQEERILNTITIRSFEAGTVKIALFTINGTATLKRSEKTLTTVLGLNTFTLAQLIDDPTTLVKGTRYYVFACKITANVVRYVNVLTDDSFYITAGNQFVLASSTTKLNYSYWLNLTPTTKVLTFDEKKYVLRRAVTGFNIQEFINNNNYAFLPPGEYTVPTKLTLKSNLRIEGVRGKTVLNYTGTDLNCLEMVDLENISLNGLTIKGQKANYSLIGFRDIGAGIIDNITQALALNGIGTKVGIYASNTKNLSISDCKVSNFDKYGVEIRAFGQYVAENSKLYNLDLIDNYGGLALLSRSEYLSVSQVHCNRNQIGIYTDSGNNMFANCQLAANRIGVQMINGVNAAHGSFTGCNFNHNSLYGIFLNELEFGQAFSNCQFWYANMYFKNVRGVLINDSLISNTDVFADGQKAGGGVTMISNSMFFNGTINQNYLGNTSDLRLRNNHKADGTTSAAYNN